MFTLPASGSGLTSLLAPNTNLRFLNTVTTGSNKGSTVVASSSNISSQSIRLMSPTKTITFQQAQQLGLVSPKKVCYQNPSIQQLYGLFVFQLKGEYFKILFGWHSFGILLKF